MNGGIHGRYCPHRHFESEVKVTLSFLKGIVPFFDIDSGNQGS